jgi:hypothetical protein
MGQLTCTPSSGVRNYKQKRPRFLLVPYKLEYYYCVCEPQRHPSRESFRCSRTLITNGFVSIIVFIVSGETVGPNLSMCDTETPANYPVTP